MLRIELSNFADIVTGQSPKSEYYTDDNNYVPFMQGNRTFGYKYPTFDTYTKKVTKIAPEGSILMSVRAPVGDLNITQKEICIGRGLAALNAKDGDNEFLYYALMNNMRTLLNCGNGTTYDSVSSDILNELQLIIPEQNRKEIGGLLASIDAKINNNTEICMELEKIAKEIYTYWFVQFDFPNKDDVPYKANDGEIIRNKEFQIDVPSCWDVKPLGNCCNFINGDRGKNYPSGDDFLDKGIPFIAGGAIDDTIIKYDELRYISRAKFDSLRAGKALYGDILMSLRGSLAKCVFSPFEEAAIASALVIIRPQDCISKSLLYMILTSDYYAQLMENYNNGSVQANLSVDVMKSFPVIVPDDATLNKFEETVRPLLEMEMNVKEESQALMDLRDFLLPMLMNQQILL